MSWFTMKTWSEQAGPATIVFPGPDYPKKLLLFTPPSFPVVCRAFRTALHSSFYIMDARVELMLRQRRLRYAGGKLEHAR